jgi:hypothetical protein
MVGLPDIDPLLFAPSLQGGRASLRAGWGCEPASLEELETSTGVLTVNCELKTLRINFVVAGSPAPLHRRCAPLPSPLKGGREHRTRLPEREAERGKRRVVAPQVLRSQNSVLGNLAAWT